LHTNLIIRSALSDDQLTQRTPWRVYLDAEAVGNLPVLRTRQPGDRFYPFGLHGRRQKLKDFMINQKSPPIRERSRHCCFLKGGKYVGYAAGALTTVVE